MSVHVDRAKGMLTQFERPKLYEQIENALRNYVIESGMQPGSKFPPERELAKLLGVSRTTVRQATVALEVHGIIEVRRNDGVYLLRKQSDADELKAILAKRKRLPEILEARETLEVKLAALAAERRTQDDLDDMSLALSNMEADIKNGGKGIAGDEAFHKAITKASKNGLLAHLMSSIAQPIEETRNASLSEPKRPPRSLAAHRKILAAIEASDPEKAAQAMSEHLKEVANVRLLRYPNP